MEDATVVSFTSFFLSPPFYTYNQQYISSCISPMILEVASQLHKHLDSNLSHMFKSMGEVTMDPSLFAVAFKSSFGTYPSFFLSLFSLIHTHTDNWERRYGGFGGAPKFPPSMQLQVLMYVCGPMRVSLVND